ncbi:MAG: two-component system cell cycle sensor histidine kinase/response regulator CckA, partial [Myxococcota bacterium]
TGARRAAALCQQMLAYAGQGPQHREVIPLRDVLNETSDLVASTLPGGVRLERSLGEVLPAVRADPTQLGQVVLNLLTNAMDAVKSTGGTVTLSGGSGWHSTSQLHRMMPRRELPAGEYAFFEVIDNGCGMSAETCARMFDPFFSTSARGHGLGLAATLGIIGSHGGGICVESQLGAGTQIRVVLPVTEQDYTAAAVVLSSCPVEQRRRVLVIDDEPTVLELVDRALGMKGYEVLLASSGAEGMAMLSDVVPDVVLLDMSMPEMSGLEVMAAIREQHPQLPVILTSGHPQSEAVQLADGFLHKPYRLSTLASTIAAAISSPRRGR